MESQSQVVNRSFKASVRSAAKQILGPKISSYLRTRTTRFVQKLKMRNLKSAGEYRKYLRGRRAIEIGGPTSMFSLGPLPIYSVLKSVDNCNFAVQTLWASSGVKYGQTYITEASDLKEIPDGAYDCVLSSHSLEHVANPLKALYDWKRVLGPDGLLLLVLPNKDHTFDWRRPVTPLEHMISDYENKAGEDDLTHLDEILELHDLSKDLAAGTHEQFHARCLKNLAFRAIHHHVFNLPSALELLKYAGFTPLLSEVHLPYDIIVLARR